MLALTNLRLPYVIELDSHKYQVACALFQEYPDGTRKPIWYWSRPLQSAEQNHSVSEKKCLEVVWALTNLRPYPPGVRCTVDTDLFCRILLL